jgi:hypothetical protein
VLSRAHGRSCSVTSAKPSSYCSVVVSSVWMRAYAANLLG